MSLLKWIGFILFAGFTGVLATKPVITYMMDRTAIHNGPWRTNLSAGSVNANLYERAAIAVAGLYALEKEETIYYTAFTDSSGETLDGRCDYRMTGQPFAARWWSLTLYGADHYLVDNSATLYSRHAGNLEFESDHSYVIAISSQTQPHNWLPAPATGAFSITLRLYNPQAVIRDDLAGTPLPNIKREMCR